MAFLDGLTVNPPLPLRRGWYLGADGSTRYVLSAGCGHVYFDGVTTAQTQTHVTENSFRLWLFGTQR